MVDPWLHRIVWIQERKRMRRHCRGRVLAQYFLGALHKPPGYQASRPSLPGPIFFEGDGVPTLTRARTPLYPYDTYDTVYTLRLSRETVSRILAILCHRPTTKNRRWSTCG